MTAWRDLAAPLALIKHRLSARRTPGGGRMLLFHDVPRDDEAAFIDLIDRLPIVDPAHPGGISLSFDDGFLSNRRIALDILAPRGIRALFFICPGLMNLDGEAQAAAVSANVTPGRRAAPEPLMAWDDVKALAYAGHVIGAHTMRHRDLTALTSEEREREIVDSGRAIRDHLGGPVDWFAYPFGDIGAIDSESLSVIKRHYRYCRSGVRGENTPDTNCMGLYSEHVDLKASRAYRLLAAEGGLDGRYVDARRRLAALAASA